MAKKIAKKAHSKKAESRKHGMKHERNETMAFEARERRMPGYGKGESYGRKGR